ncbi:MAG TPA: amidohydrolase family protein [Dehalococcoidia bacterium]|nr:amidohydrolase family protein [Dehalococcoidia bacterium]
MKPGYVVDSDAHILESPEGVRARMPEGWARSGTAMPWDGGYNRSYFGTLGPMSRPGGSSDYLRDMDIEGIDLAIFYPTASLFIGDVRDPEWETVYCRAYNDWLSDFCRANPDRLRGVALMPLHDIHGACEELNRASGKLGLVGAMVPSSFSYGPGNVGESYFDDFYREAERLRVPVGIHHSGSVRTETAGFQHFLQIHLLSHVPEQIKAVTAIVIGGVLERFPMLKVGFLEAGCGWVPFWLEHMDEEFEKRHKEVPWLRQKPSEYIRNCPAFFGVEPEEKLIPLVAREVGAGKLMYASDYPHWDSDWPDTVKTLVEREDVDDNLRQAIMCDNALSFYGLARPVEAG